MLTFAAHGGLPACTWAIHRTLEVAVDASLSLRMLEALYPPRPNHWARVWPTAVALSRWVMDAPPALLPARARELGCGVGLLGITLAHRGVRVQGTDREPMALAFARRNARDNAVTGYTTRVLDWSAPQHGHHPFLAASDVLYDPEAPQRLFEMIHRRGMLAPRGRLLLGGPVAREAPQQELVTRLTAHGYANTCHHRVVEWEGSPQEIAVHLLQRP